jgi:hypothetical protein
VPFAVIFQASHSFKRHSIVDGEFTRGQVLALIETALNTTAQTTDQAIAVFQAATDETYERARTMPDGRFAVVFTIDRQRQYDRFAQLVFRIFDQNGAPFSHYNLYLNSFQDGKPGKLINDLFEDSHANSLSPNTLTFYLRLTEWDNDATNWKERLPEIGGVQLQIDAREPDSDRIHFLPLRLPLSPETLAQWLRHGTTTIVDVHLLRVPGDEVFRLMRTA